MSKLIIPAAELIGTPLTQDFPLRDVHRRKSFVA